MRTPRVLMLSLIAIGTPSSGSDFHSSRRRSISAARASTRSSGTSRNAFSVPFSALMRSRNARQTSVAEDFAGGHPIADGLRRPCMRHPPITRGTLKRPASRAASGALASASGARQRRHDHVFAAHALFVEHVRRRLHALRIDFGHLLRVAEDVRELTREQVAFAVGQRQVGQRRDALDLLVGKRRRHPHILRLRSFA